MLHGTMPRPPSIVKSRTDHDIPLRLFPVNRRRTVSILPVPSVPLDSEHQPLLQRESSTGQLHCERNPASDAELMSGDNEERRGTAPGLRTTTKSRLQRRGSKPVWGSSPGDGSDLDELKLLEDDNDDITVYYIINDGKRYQSISNLADRPLRQKQTLSGTVPVDTTLTYCSRGTQRPPSWPSALINVTNKLLGKVYNVTSLESAHNAAEKHDGRQTTFKMPLMETGSRKTSPLLSVESHSRQLRPSTRHPTGERERFFGSDRDQRCKSTLLRRSASDNTYDQQLTSPPTYHRALAGRSMLTQSSVTLRGPGIVCSDDDLRSILYEHRQRQSSLRRRRSPTTPEPSLTQLSSDVPSNASVPLLLDGNNDDDDDDDDYDVKRCESAAFHWRNKPSDKLPYWYDAIVTSQQTYCRKSAVRHKSVPEVVFDDSGQTCGVYGALFDPEIIGQAIQEHLDRVIASSAWSKTLIAGGRQQRATLQHSAATSDCGSAVSKAGPGGGGNRVVTRRGAGPGGGGNRVVEFITRLICSPWATSSTDRL